MGKKLLFACSLLICLAIAGVFFMLPQTDPPGMLKTHLRSWLVSVDELRPGQTFDAIYVLGGGQQSLRAKFKTVSTLYDQGRVHTVYILSRPGRTEFDPGLGRNLSNDEWSLKTLEQYGVPPEDVQTVSVQAGLFGTFSEAKAVTQLAEQRSWSDLLLITSPHHTRRVRESFQACLNSANVRIQVISSQNKQSLGELLREGLKLMAYELILL
ncbi:MAG: ElyC/SanA/YdcF family protein [Desulfovermiculus sp.]|nr:ElyC/SanA/YdcF family protein [Desulfovermiculus sp.]